MITAFSHSPPLAMVRDYDGLIEAMRLRADNLGVATNVLDELAGLPTGYVGKLFGPGQVRQMGIHSFLLLAETLGLSVALHVDMDAVRRMEKRWEKRDERWRRPNRVRLGPKARARVMREIGRVGSSVRSAKHGAEKRTEWARKAAITRWRRTRKADRAELQKTLQSHRWKKQSVSAAGATNSAAARGRRRSGHGDRSASI